MVNRKYKLKKEQPLRQFGLIDITPAFSVNHKLLRDGKQEGLILKYIFITMIRRAIEFDRATMFTERHLLVVRYVSFLN